MSLTTASDRQLMRSVLISFFLLLSGTSCFAQAVPYARNYAKSREEIESQLQKLQAYAGQKLPIVDGFVAVGGKPLDQYERAFYQFTIELLPGLSSGTIVRISAKITAWYRDRDPTKSGYQVLPSNGRLELDLLDRLNENLGGKLASEGSASDGRSLVVAPKPKLDLSGIPGNAISLPKANAEVQGAGSENEAGALRQQREAQEQRMKQLNAELQGLEEIRKSQAHPVNLVVVKRGGTPVLAKPSEGSRILFRAAANDEFEFLEGSGDWIQVRISGESRGFIKRGNLELTDFILARAGMPVASAVTSRDEIFRVVREESGMFPGSWEPLKGRMVKVYTVQPSAQEAKQSIGGQRRIFAMSLFRKNAPGTLAASEDGVVVIFDSSDGGIVAATRQSLQQLADGKIKAGSFWQQCFVDPDEAFQEAMKP